MQDDFINTSIINRASKLDETIKALNSPKSKEINISYNDLTKYKNSDGVSEYNKPNHILNNNKWVDLYLENTKIERLYKGYWFIFPYRRKYNDAREELFNINRAHFIIKDNPGLDREALLKLIGESTIVEFNEQVIKNGLTLDLEGLTILINWLKENGIVKNNNDIDILINNIKYDNISINLIGATSKLRIIVISNDMVDRISKTLFTGKDNISVVLRETFSRFDKVTLDYSYPPIGIYSAASKYSKYVKAFNIQNYYYVDLDFDYSSFNRDNDSNCY